MISKINTKEDWDAYTQYELKKALPIINGLGFTIDKEQVHIGGERHLMSGLKLVLTGQNIKDKNKVIIKFSSKNEGKIEIEHEHKTRKVISNLNFSYRKFLLTEEVLFEKKDDYTISVVSYISQKKKFFDHDLKDQFFLSLRALETQEGTHITTYSHIKEIKKTFGIMTADKYIEDFKTFLYDIQSNNIKNKELEKTLSKALEFLADHKKIIDKYCNFFTHSDFVPHNIRVVDHDIYLLDHTSVHFGNKYESWARFINYMVIYNPELEEALTEYVKKNRDKEEYLALRLMRIYKLGFLLKFHVTSFIKTSGDIHILSKIRIDFWTNILNSILLDKPISKETVKKYKLSRDSLRSVEEKRRQDNLL